MENRKGKKSTPGKWWVVLRFTHSTELLLQSSVSGSRSLVVALQGTLTVGLKDLRRASPTYGNAALIELNGHNPQGLVLPPGIAHGFFFRESTLYLYAVSHYWDLADELGCRWDDPDLHIPWPCERPLLSPRDAQLPDLATFTAALNEKLAEHSPWYAWSRQYPIEWRWLPRERFRQHSYFATRLHRFTYEYHAEAVLLLDADVLIAAPFDDLIERVLVEQKLLGVPANSTPVRGAFTWERLFTHAGLGAVPYAVEHSGFGCTFHDPAKRLAPPYFNFGVLPMPVDHARRIGATIFTELETVAAVENFFRGQMSAPLAIVRQRLPWDTMSFKYNFVNDERYLLRYQREFEDVRLIHFLNNSTIHKDRTFTSVETVEQVLAGTYPNRVDRKFIETLRPIHQQVLKHL